MSKKNGWQDFLKICEQASKNNQLDQLFEFIFTAEEREQLGDRILLTQALCAGKLTQREIAAKLEISISKITRGSNALKTIDKNLKNFLGKTYE